MRKKRMSIFLVTVMLATMMCACGSADVKTGNTDAIGAAADKNKSEESETSVMALAPYDEILNEIYESLQKDITGKTEETYFSLGIQEAVMGKSVEERMKAVAYCEKDINADGVDELLILDTIYPEPGNVRILDMYTLVEGNPVKVIEGWARSRYFLLDDGMIYSSGSGGASYSNEGLLSFEADSVALTHGELYFTYPKGEDMAEIAYYYSPDGVYDVAVATEISESEFHAFREQCEQKIVVFEAKSFDAFK